MKFMMSVLEFKEVEIPDIPATVAAIAKEYGAQIDVRYKVNKYPGCSNFCELYVEIDDCTNLSSFDSKAFRKALDNCPEYDEVTMLGEWPYFQSDTQDGLIPFRQWVAAMVALYPDIVVE